MRRIGFAILLLGLASHGHAQCGTAKEVQEVSIAKGHSCVRLSDGAAECWGINMNGQLGDGTTTHRASPMLVVDLCGVRSISAGGESTCAALDDGSVRCWGLMFSRSARPLEIRGIGGVTQVAVGTVSACGLHADGTVSCWSGAEKPQTIAITNVTELTAWTTQYAAFVARKADGSVWAIDSRLRPARISIPPARHVSCGIFKCCAVLEDATATCWDPEDPIAAPVPGLRDVEQIAAGGHRYCAALRDRTVRCWDIDGNIGTLGDGTTGDHPLPTPLPALTNVRQIAPGNFNACAIVGDGTLKCWGGPTSFVGMVGDGTAEKRLIPVDVAM